MLYLGFLMSALGVGIAVFEYTERLRAVAREYAATLKLLVYLRGAVTNEKRTPSESVLRFLSAGGEEIRWASGLCTEESVIAFLRSGETACVATLLSAEDRRALSDFFLELGRTDLSEERVRLDRIINMIEKSSAEKTAESEGKIRSAWVLFATLVLGVLILII